MPRLRIAMIALALAGALSQLPAQTKKKDVIPHAQDKPPGPALSPAEALKKMQVPPGFSVELVAAEPDLVNPVAMTFDEMGRIWVTESLEYPRRSAGPGKDRVKVLEDTDGDGRADKVTVVIEGLNIPSGVAVGHGGVWVANAPDILFYPYVDREKLKLGKPEVVVTGFGRTDTHELPNSLTWGPDGWLYGLNGVFNYSHVKHRGKDYKFTCALFRIHPRTKDFELFCEGTSNPWGVAFDGEGSAFVSACVIDHLWHLVETGYYHRQGGPYPPFTWKIESIVKHKHQKAAYCGLTWFDSDAYPPEYREKLYMGNIHGNCINSDELTRDGSTYFAKPRPDFLSANDVWFMPVVQKTGPDGCLYVLDWYDRYHCYQDANRDPDGIDRLKGRFYRVRYKDTPRAGTFDLAKDSDAQLIKRLASPNVYQRETAQRLLSERIADPMAEQRALMEPLEKLVFDDAAPRKARMHALWALMGGVGLDTHVEAGLLSHKDPALRAWGVRAVGNERSSNKAVRDKVAELARDPSPDVRLQAAVAARKLDDVDPVPTLVEVLAHSGEDRLIPHVVWQNLHPLLSQRGEEFLKLVEGRDLKKAPAVARLLPRVTERLLAEPAGVSMSARLVRDLIGRERVDTAIARQCLGVLTAKVQTGEIKERSLKELHDGLAVVYHPILSDDDNPLHRDMAYLAASLHDPVGVELVRRAFADEKAAGEQRIQALGALVASKHEKTLDAVADVFVKTRNTGFRGQMLAAMGKLNEPRVADVVLGAYSKMEPELQPKAIDLLTERPAWGKRLLGEVAAKRIPADALSVNQVRKLLASKDQALIGQVKSVWGTLREDRNPERERIVADMRTLLRQTSGDAKAGAQVFKKVCAQCHKMHGEGVDVGPDITANGRSDFEQLLSNVFDPSLVIGAGYYATTVHTDAGQVLSGLLVEDNAQRVVLKTQGGELKTIPRGSIDQVSTSKVSLMPEGLEKQLQPQEIVDLFAYLTLDRPPEDPKARRIPGTPKQ